MEILVIIILAIILFIFCARYITINDKSLIGMLFLRVIKIVNIMMRNHNRTLLEQYKKFNQSNEWKVKEGKFRHYHVKKINIDGLEGSIFTPNVATNGKIILQLHGGGYEIDLPNNNLYFAKKYFKATKTFEILTINYRVAPENKYPAALEDAIKAYQYILDRGYEAKNIVFAGDSAGGGLAIATVMYLRDHQMELPKAIITMSAWTDLTNQEPSFQENYHKDPMFGNSKDSIVCISTYAENCDKTDPYISPYYGNFQDFPCMLMQVGENEMLLSDTVDVAKKATTEGVLVQATVYKGMFHVFQKYNALIPEAKDAWMEVKFFMEELFDNKQ